MEFLVSMEITMKKLIFATALITSMSVSGIAMAATDGNVGGTSVGTLDIDVTVNDAVRISGLSDLIATFDGTNDVVENSTACIYRNGTGNYNITARGDGPGFAFEIDDTVNPAVPYTVTWDDGSGPISNLTPNVTATGQVNAHQTLDDCGGGSNATVEVTVDAADLLASPSGLLEGTLTLEVAPE